MAAGYLQSLTVLFSDAGRQPPLVAATAAGALLVALAICRFASRYHHFRKVHGELGLLRGYLHRIDAGTSTDTGLLIATVEVRGLRAALDAIIHHARTTAAGWQAIAESDGLTGLANRSHFQQQATQLLFESLDIGQTNALIFIDIDGFKAVNDTQGHDVGDELLRIAAARILLTCRSPERRGAIADDHFTVKHPLDTRAHVARLGGDEFAVLLPGVASDTQAQKVAARIRRVLADPFEINGRPIVVSASVGVAVSPRDGSNYEHLLRAADTAMYHAKRLGRNRTAIYSPALDEAQRRAARDQQELQEALSKGQFELLYQPLYACHTLRIQGAEALIRWHHPHRGLVLPGEFIPLAEQLGLMDQIGEWVLGQAVQRVRAFADAGFPLVISVNVSPSQLQRTDFVTLVRRVLAHSEADPKLLQLEITESVAMQDIDLASDRLTRIAALGVSIAMDDFGTGYSNLASVIRLPFSRLKLDRTLLQNLDERPEARTLLQTIIFMANGLGLHSVAEGVETAAQLDLLGAMGCDFVQGFLLSKPVSEADLLDLLRHEQSTGRAGRSITIAA